MGLNLQTALAALQALELAVADVEKGMAQGGDNILLEAVDSAEALWNDAAFKVAVMAVVSSFKA